MIRASLATLVLATLAACGGGGGFPDAPRPIDAAAPGSFALTWTVEDMTMQPITCANANADVVIVSLVEETSRDSFAQRFNCDLGDAVSGSVPVGTYDFSYKLMSGSTMLATAPDQTGVPIQANLTAQLTAVTFVLN